MTLSGPVRGSFVEYEMRQETSGHILVKISVVVIILGILAVIVTGNIYVDDFDDPIAQPKADILGIESALKLYRLDNSHYPTTEQGLAALVERPDGLNLKNWKDGGYLHRLPTDPWGNDYHYASPGQHGPIDIYTLGRDGRVGGEGLDDTIGNWNFQD